MREKYLKYNTITSIIYQIIVIACGFILPRAILSCYGSEVNGLVNSITQFLSIVALMEMGVGSAVSSTLYKPLAEKNWKKVSETITAACSFFNKFAIGLLVYVIILSLVYPYINNGKFDHIYTASLIIIISANSFSQFYIGVVDNILLSADQKSYITYVSQAISHLANTVLCVVFIKLGFGIHIVKSITAAIYIIRPLIVKAYINRHYPINKHIKCEIEPLKQKWNAIAQHISECVLDFTDVMVLTVFATLADVSVYSVYNLIVFNVKQFFLTGTYGTMSLMGNLWACNEKEKLYDFFDKMEFFIHVAVIAIYGCTYVLIIPFITVYTYGVNGANYIQPVFAFLICLAHVMNCLRLPCFILIKAVGHYKQTQNYFIIAAFMNITISILLVKQFGLVGVAIGTLISMLYQTVCLTGYCYKNILKRPYKIFVKQMGIDIVVYILIIISTRWVQLSSVSYISWIVLAVIVAVIVFSITFTVNLLLEPTKMKSICRILFNKIMKK